MFVTVTQGYNTSTNYSLQMLWLVTCAFCLAGSLAFLLSHYVIDTSEESKPAAVSLPNVPPDTSLAPPVEEPELPSNLTTAVSVPLTPPAPAQPPLITVKPIEPKAVAKNIQRVPAKPKRLAFKAVKPVAPHLAPKPKLKVKPRPVPIQQKIASQPAKPAKSPRLKQRISVHMQPDFKTLEQSLGVDL